MIRVIDLATVASMLFLRLCSADERRANCKRIYDQAIAFGFAARDCQNFSMSPITHAEFMRMVRRVQARPR